MVENYQTLVMKLKKRTNISRYFQLKKNLDVDKTHGWDQLSVRMIKACGNSKSFPLSLIFKYMIN